MNHSKLLIRQAIPDDAFALSELICQNAQLLLQPHYSELQLEIFLRYYSAEAMLKKLSKQTIFCAENNGKIIGTIALEDDFVIGFYTRIDQIGQGIGTQLLEYLENYAKAQGIQKLELSASPIGVSFYRNRGWCKVKDMVIAYLGVDFEETLMQKKL